MVVAEKLRMHVQKIILLIQHGELQSGAEARVLKGTAWTDPCRAAGKSGKTTMENEWRRKGDGEEEKKY